MWQARHFRRAVRKVLLGLALSLPLAAVADSVPEFQLKATYLYNFASFVSWPEALTRQRARPFRYCLFGAGPIEQALRDLVHGETVNGRPLEVHRVTSTEALPDCQILYLSSGDSAAAPDLLAAVEGSPVLTVGDSAAFVEQGGMIGLVRDRLKLRLTIDLAHVERCRLRVNARLLQLATVVGRRRGATQ